MSYRWTVTAKNAAAQASAVVAMFASSAFTNVTGARNGAPGIRPGSIGCIRVSADSDDVYECHRRRVAVRQRAYIWIDDGSIRQTTCSHRETLTALATVPDPKCSAVAAADKQLWFRWTQVSATPLVGEAVPGYAVANTTPSGLPSLQSTANCTRQCFTTRCHASAPGET